MKRLLVIKAGNTVAGVLEGDRSKAVCSTWLHAQRLAQFSPRVVTFEQARAAKGELIAKPAMVANGRRGRERARDLGRWRFPD